MRLLNVCTGIFAIWLAGNSLLKTLYNAMQWINWIGGRWRTQLNAWHNVNCRTHEHRQFERILQVCAHCTPTLVSGSVDTRSIFSIVWSVTCCITCTTVRLRCPLSAVLWRNNTTLDMVIWWYMGWLQLRLHRVWRVGTCLSYIPCLRPKIFKDIISFSTWHQGGLPAEFKHINKRRKRKQLWFPE